MTKPATQFAVIEFDPARLAKMDAQAEGYVFAQMVRKALLGHDYAPGRGIVKVTLCEAPLIAPQAGIDGEMTVSA